MKTFDGALKELGPATTTTSQHETETTYSYIQVGDNILKKIRVRHGLTGPLERGLRSPETVTLYVAGPFLCGIRLPDGKTFASDMGGGWFRYGLLFILSLGFGLILTPLLGLGIPFLYVAWRTGRVLAAKRQAASIRGAIIV